MRPPPLNWEEGLLKVRWWDPPEAWQPEHETNIWYFYILWVCPGFCTLCPTVGWFFPVTTRDPHMPFHRSCLCPRRRALCPCWLKILHLRWGAGFSLQIALRIRNNQPCMVRNSAVLLSFAERMQSRPLPKCLWLLNKLLDLYCHIVVAGKGYRFSLTEHCLWDCDLRLCDIMTGIGLLFNFVRSCLQSWRSKKQVLETNIPIIIYAI